MSSWADLHERLYRLDHTIINKLEVLVNNQLSNDEYLDSNTFKLLEDPLIFSNFENYDFTDVPRENLLEVIDILKKEKIELTRVFNEVERERKVITILLYSIKITVIFLDIKTTELQINGTVIYTGKF